MRQVILNLLPVAAVTVFLAGCVNEAGSISDAHTGVSATHSKMYPAASGLLYNLNVAAVVARKGGEIKYVVSTRYISTGLGWAFFREAWSFGTQLQFKATSEQVAGCGGGSCSHIEDGAIELTRAQFERSAETGLEFKLVGKGQSIVAKVPAAAFKEALSQQ